MAAAVALKQLVRAAVRKTMQNAASPRLKAQADDPVQTACQLKDAGALGFGCYSSPRIRHRQPALKMDSVHSHEVLLSDARSPITRLVVD